MSGKLLTKRVYDPPAMGDGQRFLVDRLWPRGIKKGQLKMKAWLKEIAPSHELRREYGHDSSRWKDFQRRYFAELKQNSECWQPLLDALKKGNVTLLYSARDTEHNNAVALQRYLAKQL